MKDQNYIEVGSNMEGCVMKTDPFYCPTRQCLVCGNLENPRAQIVSTHQAWLCDRCKRVLQDYVRNVEGGKL